MANRYKAGQLIRSIQKGTRTVAVEWTEWTTTWKRKEAFVSQETKEEYCAVVQANVDKLRPETVKVSVKEGEHQSDSDPKPHYTVFEFDKDNNIITTTHLQREEKK